MKTAGAVIGTFLGMCVSVWTLAVMWSDWIVPLIPSGQYSGLIKLAVAAVLIFFGGGLAVLFVMGVSAVFGALFIWILPEGKRR